MDASRDGAGERTRVEVREAGQAAYTPSTDRMSAPVWNSGGAELLLDATANTTIGRTSPGYAGSPPVRTRRVRAQRADPAVSATAS